MLKKAILVILLLIPSPLFAQEKGDLKRVMALQKKLVSVINKGSKAYLALEGGSAVRISPQGEVLTNHHVVSKRKVGDRWYVMGPEKKIHLIQLIAVDPWGDLALLKISSPTPAPFLPLAPAHSSRKGEMVLALGNPFSFSKDGKPSASLGIISGLNLREYNYFLAIQTDAPVNPGNSGGPLINLKGELVGITGKISARFGSGINTGVGYAISVEEIRHLLPALRKGGKVYHGTLKGILFEIQTLKPKVQTVLSGSSEERVGLKGGDVFLKVGGFPIQRQIQFWSLVNSYPEKTLVSFTLLRKGKKIHLQIPLARYNPPRVLQGQKPFLGVRIEKNPKGFMVVEVAPRSPAERGGMVKGDVILKIDGKTFARRSAVGKYMRAKKVGDEVDLLIQRKSRVINLTVVLGAKR